MDQIKYPVWMDEEAHSLDGKTWVRGNGSIPAPFLFVGERPADREVKTRRVFSGQSGELLFNRLTMLGFNQAGTYYLTNAVKYALPKNKSVTAKDLKVCKPMLDEEIKRVAPKVIVCLGTQALTTVLGRGISLGTVRGEFIRHPTLEGVQVFGMHNPAYVLRNPETLDAFDRDIMELVRFQRGEVEDRCKVESDVLNKAEHIRLFIQALFETQSNPVLVIDLEWDGKTWMDPKRYVRTVQIGYAPGKAVIVEMHGENGVPAMDDEAAAWLELKRLFEDPRVGIIGHNVIADGHWLLGQNIDIRPRVVWDTMLAEYLLSETGPWDLGELALKYTKYRRYSLSLELWVKAHQNECAHGYGPVPRDLLLPYGAIDVDAPRQITEKQMPEIAKAFTAPRGVHGQYPSLWATTMRTQELLYEIERTGMLVDQERLTQLINAYQSARSQLLGVITTEATGIGFEGFSPTSTDSIRKLLFEYLQLPPVKTTEGRAWVDQVGNQGMDNDTDVRASTDKTTLEILEDANPIVKHILQFRRIDTACKTWLRWAKDGEDEASVGGGIPAKIWPDGRLHARFSQLAETGRFRTSKPNVQNWPKKAEGYMAEIFGGKDKVPPQVRTIVVPPPGFVFMEGDFQQAELFVLAALSGDPAMMSALSTPGRDLHDTTAISAFQLRVVGLDGQEVPEDVLINLAKANLAKGGAESKEFKAFVKTLTYIDPKGKRMTRDEFKNTIRVSAKNVNFGIPLTPWRNLNLENCWNTRNRAISSRALYREGSETSRKA